MSSDTPAKAFQRLVSGNARFFSGAVEHPDQDAAKRVELSTGQKPFALIFGCADSRVAAEIIFDQGLGDLFVVRTAGHIIDFGVLGSIEFGVDLLQIPLIVILGHDSCGAVTATLDSVQTNQMPGGYIRDIVERVMPSALAARAQHPDRELEVDEVVAVHVMETARLLAERSQVVANAIKDGKLAIVGATYKLLEGEIHIEGSLGAISS